jgi:hypothetical protein
MPGPDFRDVTEFREAAERGGPPPAGLPAALEVLWRVKAGDWEGGHRIAQDLDTPEGARLHALLHLMEGDTGNARYWYLRAGVPARTASGVEAEWTELARQALDRCGRP